MTTRTLVLDAGYQPHRIVGWGAAAQLIYKGRAEVVDTYDDIFRRMSGQLIDNLELSRPMRAWFDRGIELHEDVIIVRMPAVIRLLNVIGRKKVVKFSRINVFTRDNFTCQYCGEKFPMSQLNFDHVIPKSRGGRTVWENIVTACYNLGGVTLGCNDRKANLTVEQSGMTPRKWPVKPKSLPIVAMRLDDMGSIPDAWRSWIYWHTELES